MLKLHLIILIQEWLSNSQLQWIVFSGGLAQTSFGAFNKTVLPECLVNKRLHSIASPMKDLKLKEEVLICRAAGAAGVAIGMLGSAIGKGDGDAATFTKKREERRFDEQYFKGVGTGLFRTTIMPGIEPQ
jgi:hypothetical protein